MPEEKSGKRSLDPAIAWLLPVGYLVGLLIGELLWRLTR